MGKDITNDCLDASTLNDFMYKLRSVEYVEGFSSEQVKQQLALSYSLIVITSGELQLILDHQHVELNRHAVYLGLPESTYGGVISCEELEMYIFHFDVFQQRVGDEGSLHLIEDAKLFHPQGKIMIDPQKGLDALCGELYRKWKRKEKQELFRCQIDFQEILYYIYKYQLQEATSSFSALEAAKQYMEEHFAEPLFIEQLAQVTRLSPKYFVDLYKKKYGKSAMDYVTELRLQEAKRLMGQSDVKLRDIAHRVGYADEFYFSRKFKKEIGVAPTVYMNRRRRKLVAYHSGLIGHLIALNILPYAAPLHPKWTENYYRDYRNEIPVHLSAFRYNKDWQQNINQLQRLSVDLILAIDDIEESEKSALENISPNLCLIRANLNWREQLRYIAEELGELWQAETWLAGYEQQVQEARKQLEPLYSQHTFVCLRMVNKELSLYCNDGMASLLYEDLGLAPAHESDALTYNKEITLGELNELNPDHILMLVRQDGETLEHWLQLQNDPQWQVITAVHRKRVHQISSDPWREYSSFAQLRMLDQIMRLLVVDYPSQFRILSMDESMPSLYT